MTERAWTEQAKCAGMDADLFFPDRGSNAQQLAAKAVCAECPVRLDCLEHAITEGERHGIWGGMSERERRRIRKARGVNVRRCTVCLSKFDVPYAQGVPAHQCSPECRAEAQRLKHERYRESRLLTKMATRRGRQGVQPHRHGVRYTAVHHCSGCAACKGAERVYRRNLRREAG